MFAPRHRTDMMCPYPRSKERGLSGPRRGWFGGAGASADRAPGWRRMKTAAARRRPSRKFVVLPAVAPVFTLPGRARVRVEGLRRKPDVATRLTARLTGQPAIRRVQASTLTGNVLIIFDAPALDLRRLLAVVAEAA